MSSFRGGFFLSESENRDPMKLLIYNANQVVQICNSKENVLTGNQMKSVKPLNGKPDDGISIVVNKEGNIEAIGFDSEIEAKFFGVPMERRIDASELCILPGFVDGHTHPIWAGDRVHEFRMKLAGASYMEIHKAGGGIHFTVDHTKNASDDELYALLKERLERMVQSGTTTVECKSGYGLDCENELRLLKLLTKAQNEMKSIIDISITYCGAHAFPKGMDENSATKDILENQIPRIEKEIKNGSISVQNIDVFCEKGVFELENTKKILEAGRKIGLQVNFHAEEFHDIGGANLGAQMKAKAVSHLEKIDDNAIELMAQNGTVGVLLPTTAYILRLEPPPARKMIDTGVPVALGSDFNPNAYCLNMPMVMHLSCNLFGMSLEEALVASTLNSAASLGISKTHGSIEVGKKADLIFIDVPTWEHTIYQFGELSNIIQLVLKNGNVAFDKANIYS